MRKRKRYCGEEGSKVREADVCKTVSWKDKDLTEQERDIGCMRKDG